MNTITFTSDQLCALDDFVVLHIRGADARTFMHAQLTQAVDSESLNPDQAVLAGYCQAKGRLQASMLLYVDPEDSQHLYAMIHRSIAETVRKRLSMFLLRAKAELVLSELRVYGITHDAPTTAFTLPTTHYEVQQSPAGTLIAAPSHNGTARAWLISTENQTCAVDAAQWQVADLYAGLPWVQETIYEAFLPQDVNLDIVGGVSFKKGCFPGQEVVARLHYRTTAKRRGALGVIATEHDLALAAGSDIFDADDSARPFGRIINSAYDAQQQQQVLLMEVLIEDIEHKNLVTAAENGHTIQLQTLPYAWEIAKY